MARWMLVVVLFLWPVAVFSEDFAESRCVGVPAQGRLIDGWKLPLSGPNFGSYSWLGWALGRTHVHSRVHRAMLGAYARLEKTRPSLRFIYGETGLAAGGKFSPHVTHQNGLSVDFMVPVVDSEGKSADFPGSISNRFGYDLEFDAEGRWQGYRIDFEAMAEHLFQLHLVAEKEGIRIRLVIFAPELSRKVFQTRRGKYLATRVRFHPRPAKVRHDDHYHVDFSVPCPGEKPESPRTT